MPIAALIKERNREQMMNPSQSQPAARASLLVSCVLALCIAALPACTSKTKSKDNVAIPKALTKLEQKVELQKVWSGGSSSDNAVRGEHLGPSVVGDWGTMPIASV